MKTKKIPIRKCVGCNSRFEKRDLIRIVNNKDEGLSLDLSGKKNGRGAYICKNINCFENIVKKNSLYRVLGIQLDQELSIKVREEILKSQ